VLPVRTPPGAIAPSAFTPATSAGKRVLLCLIKSRKSRSRTGAPSQPNERGMSAVAEAAISLSDVLDLLTAMRTCRNGNRRVAVVTYERPHLASIALCSLDKYHAGTAHSTARPLPFRKFNAKQLHPLNAIMSVARATFISGRNTSATVICRYGYSATAQRLRLTTCPLPQSSSCTMQDGCWPVRLVSKISSLSRPRTLASQS
jgi:hypothetical protein